MSPPTERSRAHARPGATTAVADDDPSDCLTGSRVRGSDAHGVDPVTAALISFEPFAGGSPSIGRRTISDVKPFSESGNEHPGVHEVDEIAARKRKAKSDRQRERRAERRESTLRKVCAQCGQEFDKDSKPLRTTKVYCDENCRSRAFRKRARQARPLRGWS
jgi:hypothetical protein